MGERRVIEHIRFCIDEIECEIEVPDTIGLSTAEIAEIRVHIEGMRAVLDASEVRKRTRRAKAKADDLTLIKGIDETTAESLIGLGVRRFSTIAALTRADIELLAEEGIAASRISAENWIEQAAILQTGRMTAYAEGRLRIGGDSVTVATLSAAAAIETDAAVASTPATAHPAIEPEHIDAATHVTPAADLAAGGIARRIAASLLVAAVLGSLHFAGSPALASVAHALGGH